MQVSNTHLYIHRRKCPHTTKCISKREIMSYQKPLVRKVIVRRKPLNSIRTSLVKNPNNKSELHSSLIMLSEKTQPKRRVVIFKNRLTNNKRTDIIIKVQSTIPSTMESSIDTFEPVNHWPITPTTTFTLKSTSPSSKIMRPRRRMKKKLRMKVQQSTKLTPEQTLYPTTTVITTPVLYTRTYTYVVERVQNDQTEQLQSISTFTRVSTRHLTLTTMHTLFDINNITGILTQIDPDQYQYGGIREKAE